MTARAPLVFLMAALALLACSRRKEPSPEYLQAAQLFGRLSSEKGDDAFDDPELAEVERLLGLVPADSLDAPSAAELRLRIAGGKKRLAEERAASERALAEARTPPSFPSSNRPEAPAAAAPSEPKVEEAADAGPSQPTLGMSVAEFTQRFSRCFQLGQQILVGGKGMHDTWELKNLATCRDLHPGFDQQLLIVQDGKLWGRAPRSALERRLPDGGVPPANAGSTP